MTHAAKWISFMPSHKRKRNSGIREMRTVSVKECIRDLADRVPSWQAISRYPRMIRQERGLGWG
jgi:hypothetical protein